MVTIAPSQPGAFTLPQEETLRTTLAQIVAPYPVALAYLFGSAAVGQTTLFSDVDIALVLEAGAEVSSRLHLELEIEDELALRGVNQADVRVINDAPLELKGQVVTNGRLLYARDDEIRIAFETRTRSEYFDFQPVAEALRQALFEHVRERGLNG